MAEDVRALARSLGRDVRHAAREARQRGDWKGRQVRDELRGVADQARRNWWPGPHPRDGDWCDWRARRGSWLPPTSPPYPDGDTWGAWPPGGRRGRRPSARSGWAPSPRHGGTPPGAAPVAVPRVPRRTREPLPPLRHQRDGSTLLAVLIVGVGVLGALVASHAVDLSLEMVAAAALMALGATMVLTARTDWSLSRRSWPVWVGLGLVAVLVTTSTSFGVPQATRDLSIGPTSFTADPQKPLPGLVRGGLGNVVVDLTRLTPAYLAQARTLTVVDLAGNIIVNLPQNASVAIDARSTAGSVCVPNQPTQSGPNPRVLATVGNQTPPPFRLTVHDGAGSVRITQAGSCG